MIVILARISRAVTCCAYRTGPERAQGFLSGSDGGEQRTTRTHTEWPLATHWLTSTVIYVRATDVGCDRALCVWPLCSCVRRWARTVGQLHPAENPPAPRCGHGEPI